MLADEIITAAVLVRAGLEALSAIVRVVGERASGPAAETLTYDMLTNLIGMPRMALANCLNPIQSYCLVRNLEPLTVLVVGETSGVPGDGFIAAEDIPRALSVKRSGRMGQGNST